MNSDHAKDNYNCGGSLLGGVVYLYNFYMHYFTFNIYHTEIGYGCITLNCIKVAKAVGLKEV